MRPPRFKLKKRMLSVKQGGCITMPRGPKGERGHSSWPQFGDRYPRITGKANGRRWLRDGVVLPPDTKDRGA
jgi:hypothetical protein